MIILASMAAVSCASSQSSEETPDDFSFNASPPRSAYVQQAYDKNQRFAHVYYGSNFLTMTKLDKEIALYYATDSVPGNPVFIVHGFRRARSGNCEHATINALHALQADAKKVGANAIINLKPSWDGSSLEDGSDYFCAGGGLMFGIDWGGDFVKIDLQPQPAAQTPGAAATAAPTPEVSITPVAEPAKAAPAAEETVVITVTKKGEAMVSDKVVSKDYLEGMLEEKYKTNPFAKIVIQADSGVQYGKVVKIMEMVKGIGFSDVAATEKEQEAE
jgi:biopolymer transport protein ExbD